MGRPVKNEKRHRQLNIGLTDSELDSIRRRAEAIGMRPVHFGRAILLDEKRSVSVRGLPENNIERLVLAQLARLGNLLNQLVRHIHRTGDPLPADLEPLLNDIRQIIARGHRK